jgi:Ca2+-binding RTX toxin-like protein
MSALYIEGKPVAGSSNEALGVALHAYIVYVDNDGNEFVLRGGPGGPANLSSFGSISIQNGPLSDSKDARGDLTPDDRGQTLLPLGDERSADDVYFVMNQLLTQIADARIAYYPYSTLTYSAQNSNSTIGNLLQLVGLSFNDVDPQPSGWTPLGYVGGGTIFDFARTIQGSNGIDYLYGAAGNDTLNGNAGRDRLYGGGGGDTLNGGDGNDLLYGGSGNDKLIGGNGNDILNGYDDSVLSLSTSADTMDGQAGADWYYMSLADTARDTGTDKLNDLFYYSNYFKFSDADGYYTSYYRWGASDIPTVAQPEASPLRAQLTNSVTDGDAVTLTTQDAVRAGFLVTSMTETGALTVARVHDVGSGEIGDFDWADGNLHLDVGREALSTVGTSGNDELEGTRGADILIGGAGDDEIEGKTGDDELSGEDGNDEIEGGKGNDKLYGDRGDDKLDGGDGNDSLWGGTGNDRLAGDKGNDMLSGNLGDDTLRGGDGLDRLLGGLGIDNMTGGEGRDTFVFHFGDGADIITDFSGARGRGEGGHGGRHGGGHDDDYRSGDLIEISSDLTGFDVFADILAHASQVGDNTVIDFGSGDTLTLQHTRVTNLHADSFAFM